MIAFDTVVLTEILPGDPTPDGNGFILNIRRQRLLGKTLHSN
jgi:hypothetical protein